MTASSFCAADFRAALAEPMGDTMRWPRDDEFRRSWVEGEMYPGRLDPPRLRAIFHRLETAMRSSRTEEDVPLTFEALDVEHVLPQSWYEHWPLPGGTPVTAEDAQQARLSRFADPPPAGLLADTLRRELHVPRFGNLTLLHYGVNRHLQNRDFMAKRRGYLEHSNLQLNRELMVLEGWDEASIERRGEALFGAARDIWRGPA